MSNRKTWVVGVLVGGAIGASAAWLFGLFPSVAVSNLDDTGPTPGLLPEQVVQIQLASLARGEVGECFRFASPMNREITGPLARFGTMFRSPPFDIMLRSSSFQVGKSVIRRDYAAVLVTVLAVPNELRVFRFIMSRQTSGPQRGCWMTDGVFDVSGALSTAAPPSNDAASHRVPTRHRQLGNLPHDCLPSQRQESNA